MLDVLFTTIALMVGTAGLPHIIVRFYTVPNVRAARFSAGWALLFIAILYTTAPALSMFARYNLIDSLHNHTIAEVQQLDWANKWEKTKLLAFDDKNKDGRFQLTPNKDTSEIKIDRDIIVLSTPEVAKLAPWVIGLGSGWWISGCIVYSIGFVTGNFQFHRPRYLLPDYGFKCLRTKTGICWARHGRFFRSAGGILWGESTRICESGGGFCLWFSSC